MPGPRPQHQLPAVGIDLGTTYSSLAVLTPQGKPETLPNSDGELSTPSVVLFDGKDIVVGTEALRRSVAQPDNVVQFAKRFMGDERKVWRFNGKSYRPQDISALILRTLLDSARQQLGPIRQAVITVPAQFSELQRQATVEAGQLAGLQQVDIINEPSSAALCHVMGEGLWFAELANAQNVLVFDLGGGTLDLSLVRYDGKRVEVVATGGDLQLGGLDWNKALEDFACEQFTAECGQDPRLDRESRQALSLEVEHLKRSLSVRDRSPLRVQHAGRNKTYTIERDHFELLTEPLVERARQLTIGLLESRKLGWAHVDGVLVTGGASRMPMIRQMLKRISGTTLNSTLSPDQSICHGAAYYAGMRLAGRKLEQSSLSPEARQKLARVTHQSVCGRALGILVRDPQTGKHYPHYLIAANTPIPCSSRQRFGTAVANQQRVHVRIVESGTLADDKWVNLGDCVIEGLTPNLPLDSPVEVRIRYDEQARVHVEAVEVASGRKARTTIVREAPIETPPGQATAESLVAPVAAAESPVAPPAKPAGPPKPPVVKSSAPRVTAAAQKRPVPAPEILLEQSERPVPLCTRCGEMLDAQGRCRDCVPRTASRIAEPRKS